MRHAFDKEGKFAHPDEYYEEHKKMLVEGNCNMGGNRKADMECPPSLRGVFSKICGLEHWHVSCDGAT